MKISNILSEDVPGANDTRHGSRLSLRQIEMVYNKVMSESQPLTVEEVNEMAQDLELNSEFGRTSGSAYFAIMRMHILIHGMAPYDVSEGRAETMFANFSKAMEQFADSVGINAQAQISSAREEMKSRPQKVKRPDAMKMMSEYYMKMKNRLSPEVKNHRDEIIGQLMNGVSAEEAFSPYLK